MVIVHSLILSGTKKFLLLRHLPEITNSSVFVD